MFRAKRSILDPFRAIFDDLGPNRHCGPDLDLQDQAGDGPLEWVRPVPKAPERSWHASGPSFRPNRRFSTHFGPNLMFLDRTGTLVNQDWTWAEAWADLGLRPTLDDLGLRLGPILDQPWADFWTRLGLRRRESVVETGQMSSVETRQMSQQQSSVLSQQQTSVLSQQKTSVLSQQKT